MGVDALDVPHRADEVVALEEQAFPRTRVRLIQDRGAAVAVLDGGNGGIDVGSADRRAGASATIAAAAVCGVVFCGGKHERVEQRERSQTVQEIAPAADVAHELEAVELDANHSPEEREGVWINAHWIGFEEPRGA